jgi:RNA polymerase sigma-70 factor (ECF subfamily)
MPTDAVPPVPEAPDIRVDALTGVSESVLIAGMRRGDPTSMTTLFRGYFTALVAFVRSYVGSVDEAEELVAAFFARLWERRETWAPRHTIESYLFASVRNAALNAERAARRETNMNAAALDSESPSVLGAQAQLIPGESEEESVIASMRAAVSDALTQLPESSRVILEMRWTRQMSYEAIAEVIGGTASAVQRQHSRVLARLRAIVERLNE